MRRFSVFSLFFLMLITLAEEARAQQVILAAGSDAVGSNGSVTWSVGQTAFSTLATADFTILEGVQQPFEFQYHIGIGDPRITAKCLAFPNPSEGIITLCIDHPALSGYRYELRDMEAKLLAAESIGQKETSISMEKYSSSVCLLTIFQHDLPVQTIRIIKR
jgi:hypothetical protein